MLLSGFFLGYQEVVSATNYARTQEKNQVWAGGAVIVRLVSKITHLELGRSSELQINNLCVDSIQPLSKIRTVGDLQEDVSTGKASRLKIKLVNPSKQKMGKGRGIHIGNLKKWQRDFLFFKQESLFTWEQREKPSIYANKYFKHLFFLAL